MLIKKWNYGNYSSDNYGAHSIALTIGSLTLWFSYDTVVAFQENGHLRKISKNFWGPTTGKHLNWIDPSKHNRLDSTQFLQELRALLDSHHLTP